MFEDFCFDINYYYFTFLASFSSHCPFLLFSLSCSGVTLSHLVFLLLFAYRMLSLSCNLPSCLSFLSSSIPLLPSLSLLYFCYILLLCDYLFCSILFCSVLFSPLCCSPLCFAVSTSVSACDSSMIFVVALVSFCMCVNLVCVMNINLMMNWLIYFLVLYSITTYISWDDDIFYVMIWLSLIYGVISCYMWEYQNIILCDKTHDSVDDNVL